MTTKASTKPRGRATGTDSDTAAKGVWTFVSALALIVAISETLRWAYTHLIYPEYSYFGYYLNPVDVAGYATAVALATICAVALPKKLERPSHSILWILYAVAVLPTILVPHYAVRVSDQQATMISIQASVAMLAIVVASARLNANPKPLLMVRENGVFWGIVAVWTLVLYAILVIRLGVPTSLPSLDDVYGVRDDYKSSLGGSTLLGYAIPAQASVVNPILIARGLYTRRPQWIIAGIVLQLMIFSYSGLKSVLLSTFALLLFYWLLTRRRPRGMAIPLGIVVGSFFTMVMDVVQSTTIWTSLGIRRFIVVPGVLSGAYVDTFSGLDKAHWGYSLLSWALDYPYGVAPSYLVGGMYFDRPEMNANANFFADGYANWGYMGVLVEAAFIVLLLWMIDSSTSGLPNEFATLVFVVPAIAFANSSAFTTAMTHGVIAGVVLCTFLPRTGWVRSPGRKTAALGTG